MDELKVDDKLLNRLQISLAMERYINVSVREDEKCSRDLLQKEFIGPFKKPNRRQHCLDVDVSAFYSCENEKQEADVFLKMLSERLARQPELSCIKIKDGFSIAHIMDQINESLDKLGKSVLLIFYYFNNHFDEKEKDILRSIRKYIGMTESARHVAILVLSSDTVDQWELFPESNLDERYVKFLECDQ